MGANGLPRGDVSQAYSTGVVSRASMESNQMKFSVLRGSPKSATWGGKHRCSSRDIHSQNMERLSKIKRNFLSWFESYFWCYKTAESKRGDTWCWTHLTDSLGMFLREDTTDPFFPFHILSLVFWFVFQKEKLTSSYCYNWCSSVWLVYLKQSETSERNNSKHRKRVLHCSIWTKKHNERIIKHMETRSTR